MGAKREYTAIFAIGAKLLGSFRGAMTQANARLKGLQAAAKRATGSVLGLKTAMGGLLALVGGFAIGKIFGQIFGGATEEAMAAEQRTRSLLVSLMQMDSIRKKGPKEAQKQLQLILKHNEALEKQGVLHHTILDAMAVQIQRGHIPPKQTQETVEKLADVLVATSPHGPRASLAEGTKLAFMFTKAAASGKLIGLQKQGVFFTKEQQKGFLKLSNQLERYNYLMKTLRDNYGDVNAQAQKTDVGAIQLFQNALTTMSEDIGKDLLPAQAEMARAWKEALPEITPLLITGMKLILKLVIALGRTVRTQLIPWWHEFQKTERFEQVKNILQWCVDNFPTIAKWAGIIVASLIGLNILTSLATIFLALTSPVGLITLAILALAAAFFLLWQNWDLIKSVPVLGPLVKLFEAAARVGIAALNALGATISAVFTGNWQAAGEAWKTLWNEIVNEFSAGKAIIVGVFKFIGQAAEKYFVRVLENAKTLWDYFLHPSKIKDAFKNLNIPDDIQAGTGFASGGIITHPIVAKVGEAGPEAIIPLRQSARSYSLLGQAARALGRRVTPGSAFFKEYTPMAEGGIVGGKPTPPPLTGDPMFDWMNKYFAKAQDFLGTRDPTPTPNVGAMFGELWKAYQKTPPVDVGGAIGRSLNEYLMPGVKFPAPTPYPTGPGAIASGDVGRAWKAFKDNWANEMQKTFHPTAWIAEQKRLHPHKGYVRPPWLQRFLGPPAEWEKARKELPRFLGGEGKGALSTPTPTPKPSRYMGVQASPTSVHFNPVITIHGNASESEQQALDSKLRDLARDFVSNFKRAQSHERRLSYEGGYG